MIIQVGAPDRGALGPGRQHAPRLSDQRGPAVNLNRRRRVPRLVTVTAQCRRPLPLDTVTEPGLAELRKAAARRRAPASVQQHTNLKSTVWRSLSRRPRLLPESNPTQAAPDIMASPALAAGACQSRIIRPRLAGAVAGHPMIRRTHWQSRRRSQSPAFQV